MNYGNPAPASFKLKTGDAGGAGGGLIKFINGLSGSLVSRDKPPKMGDSSGAS